MASSLGYAMMNWTSEFARHAKAKRNKKKHSKNKENCDNDMHNPLDFSGNETKHSSSKSALDQLECSDKNEVEIQTDGKLFTGTCCNGYY